MTMKTQLNRRDWFKSTLALTAGFTLTSALTEKLMVFALGRAIEYPDMPVIRGIVRGAAARDNRFADLVKGVAHSAAFQQQRVPLPAPATPAPQRQARNEAP